MAEQCEKHQDCMERIHTAINEIKNSNASAGGKMEGFTESVNNFLSAIRKDMYSPGGIVDKVGTHGFQLAIQWGALGVIVVAIVLKLFNS